MGITNWTEFRLGSHLVLTPGNFFDAGGFQAQGWQR
jgi:hypothetical protein